MEQGLFCWSTDDVSDQMARDYTDKYGWNLTDTDAKTTCDTVLKTLPQGPCVDNHSNACHRNVDCIVKFFTNDNGVNGCLCPTIPDLGTRCNSSILLSPSNATSVIAPSTLTATHGVTSPIPISSTTSTSLPTTTRKGGSTSNSSPDNSGSDNTSTNVVSSTDPRSTVVNTSTLNISASSFFQNTVPSTSSTSYYAFSVAISSSSEVPKVPDEAKEHLQVPVGATVGAVFGGLLLLAIAGGLILLLLRRKSKSQVPPSAEFIARGFGAQTPQPNLYVTSGRPSAMNDRSEKGDSVESLPDYGAETSAAQPLEKGLLFSPSPEG